MAPTNLRCVRSRSAERAFKVVPSLTKGVNAILVALYNFLTATTFYSVVNGFRRSDSSADAVIEDFKRADVNKVKISKDRHFKAALQKTEQLFLGTHTWRPVHFTDLRWYPFNLQSSVEAPFCDDANLRSRIENAYAEGKLPSARMNMRNCYNAVFDKCRDDIHYIKDLGPKGDRWFYYMKAHARSHIVESSEEDKIRMVYGVPKLLIMAELMLLWPMIQFLRRGLSPLAWGYEILQGGFYRIYAEMFNRTENHLRTFFGIDWKRFDKNVMFSLIDPIHDMIFKHIDLDNGYIPTTEYPNSTLEKWRLTNLFTWMRHAIKHTPIRLPDGSEWKRRFASIPSGLLQTQVLDSMINCLVILTCLSELGINIDLIYIKVMGDDSLVGITEMITGIALEQFRTDFANIALRRFGFVMNDKIGKSNFSNLISDLSFLGYNVLNAEPYRDPIKLLAQFLYPERRHDASQLMARCVGIAMASCGQPSYVYDLCKEVFDHLSQLGYTPNPSLIQKAPGYEHIVNQILSSSDRFPERFEMFSELMSVYPAQLDQDDRHWNRLHFLAEA